MPLLLKCGEKVTCATCLHRYLHISAKSWKVQLVYKFVILVIVPAEILVPDEDQQG